MSRPIVVTACMFAPPNRRGLNSTHMHGTSVPMEEPSTGSIADITCVERPPREGPRCWDSRQRPGVNRVRLAAHAMETWLIQPSECFHVFWSRFCDYSNGDASL